MSKKIVYAAIAYKNNIIAQCELMSGLKSDIESYIANKLDYTIDHIRSLTMKSMIDNPRQSFVSSIITDNYIVCYIVQDEYVYILAATCELSHKKCFKFLESVSAGYQEIRLETITLHNFIIETLKGTLAKYLTNKTLETSAVQNMLSNYMEYYSRSDDANHTEISMDDILSAEPNDNDAQIKNSQ